MNFYESAVIAIRDQYYPPDYQMKRIVDAKRFIEKQATSNIQLKDMAAEAFLSKFHFIRLFKKCYGRTPHQLVFEIRMVKAKQLLQSGCTIAETCFQLGFESTTTFAGAFKKYTGYTPTQFQQKKQF